MGYRIKRRLSVEDRLKQDWGQRDKGQERIGGKSIKIIYENVIKKPVTLKMKVQQFSEKANFDLCDFTLL